jgi:DNA-directed RNA polymerase specialized sigma subunit
MAQGLFTVGFSPAEILQIQAKAKQMLLEGKTQAVIAHVLGISEGNVSRLRARTFAELRRLLADEP